MRVYRINDDISTVPKSVVPDHTLLVGGFPCQDYSVAHTLASSQGVEGKKGDHYGRTDICLQHRP